MAPSWRFGVVTAGAALAVVVGTGLAVGGGGLALALGTAMCIVIGAFLVLLAVEPSRPVRKGEAVNGPTSPEDPWDALRRP